MVLKACLRRAPCWCSLLHGPDGLRCLMLHLKFQLGPAACWLRRPLRGERQGEAPPGPPTALRARAVLCAFLLMALLVANCDTREQKQDMAPRVLRIATFGDSITKGTSWVKRRQTYTYVLGKILEGRGIKVEMLRKGVSGETTRGALKRLEKDVIAQKPDVVTIMYGTNDAFIDVHKDEKDTTPRISLENYEKNLNTIIRKLKEHDIKPVLMNSIPMGNFWVADVGIYAEKDGNFKLETYVDIVRRVAAQEKVPLVDHFDVWIRRKNKGQNINNWLADGLHPNTDGHRFIAKTIFNTLGEAFFRPGDN